MKVILFELSK